MKPIFTFLCLIPSFLFANPAGPDPVKVLGVEIQAIDISCIGQVDGILRVALIDGNSPVLYQWSGPGGSGSGQLSNIDPIDLKFNLPAGAYSFTLTDAIGALAMVQAVITEPAALQGNFEVLSDYNGYGVSCFYSLDGKVRAAVSGGTPPFTYVWSSGDNTEIADSLPVGICQISVLDFNNCPLSITGSLSAPPPIMAGLKAQGEKCLGQNIGAVEITSITGGVAPYQVIFDNQPPSAQTAWYNLSPGNYFLAIIDANGCRKDEGAVLPTGLELTLDIGSDSSMYTGDTLLYQLTSNRPLSAVTWTPPAQVFSLSPDQVLLFPDFSTTYIVSAVDTNGCIALDKVRITVHRNRSVYIPNVFAPESATPENGTFTVFGSGGIETVVSLRVFDRFGRLWFENNYFPVNQPDAGWPGNSGNERALPGVYLYQAVVRFTDGREETFLGDVTLLR